MTRTTNARVAGAAFLVYIAAGIPDMVLSARVTAGDTVAAKLTSVALHATEARVAILLVLILVAGGAGKWLLELLGVWAAIFAVGAAIITSRR